MHTNWWYWIHRLALDSPAGRMRGIFDFHTWGNSSGVRPMNRSVDHMTTQFEHRTGRRMGRMRVRRRRKKWRRWKGKTQESDGRRGWEGGGETLVTWQVIDDLGEHSFPPLPPPPPPHPTLFFSPTNDVFTAFLSRQFPLWRHRV